MGRYHDHPEYPLVQGIPDSRIKIFQRPEPRIHVPVIGYVISAVRKGRGIWAEPHGINPKVPKVIGPRGNAGDIARPSPFASAKLRG